MPDLIEVVRGGEGQPPARPDERALRAAGSVLAPEPDLFAVASPHGAVVSRRAGPAPVHHERAGGLIPHACLRFASRCAPGLLA